MTNVTTTSIAKYGPPAVALSFPESLWAQFDPIMALALSIGLVAGVLWRAGDARKKGYTWDGIKDDLLVSCLIGLSNLVIAAIVVQIMRVSPLYAIGVAMIIAGKGPDALEWFGVKFIGERVKPSYKEKLGLTEKSLKEETDIPLSKNQDLEDMAEQLDKDLK